VEIIAFLSFCLIMVTALLIMRVEEFVKQRNKRRREYALDNSFVVLHCSNCSDDKWGHAFSKIDTHGETRRYRCLSCKHIKQIYYEACIEYQENIPEWLVEKPKGEWMFVMKNAFRPSFMPLGNDYTSDLEK